MDDRTGPVCRAPLTPEPQLLTHRGSRTPPCVFPGHLSLSCQGVLRPCRSCPPRFFHLCGPGPGPLGPGPQTPENTSHCVLALHTKEPQNEPCPQNSDPIIKISLSWPILCLKPLSNNDFLFAINSFFKSSCFIFSKSFILFLGI